MERNDCESIAFELNSHAKQVNTLIQFALCERTEL